MRSAPEKLKTLVRQEVELLGYELVGVELTGQSKGATLLRIYIDHADGITLDDCVAVSHQVSGVLDVEDPIKENYRLEVSSPGLDRPLKSERDFIRFLGKRISVKTFSPVEGRKTFEGRIADFKNNTLYLDDGGAVREFLLQDIAQARLIIEF